MGFVGRVCALAVVAAAVLAGTAAQGQSVIPLEREASYERMAIEFKSSIRGGSIEPHWMADGHSFWYAEGPSTNPSILKVDPTSNRVTPLLDAAKLRAALGSALGHELGPNFPFEDYSYGRMGQVEVPDHVATLKQLAATRPYMDTSRVGFCGYSFGGYYTIRAMLTAPEVFHVGVAGAPLADLDAVRPPIEPYMGLPQDNFEAYEKGSNIKVADQLKGKLLIVIGTNDTNASFEHSMRLANAFFRANKQIDMKVLPEEYHTLSEAGIWYYVKARNEFLVQYLKP